MRDGKTTEVFLPTCRSQPYDLSPGGSSLAQRHGIFCSAEHRRVIIHIPNGDYCCDTRAPLGHTAVRHHHSEVVKGLGFEVKSLGQKQTPNCLKASSLQEPHAAFNLERISLISIGNGEVEATVFPREVAVKGLESQNC